MNKINPNDISEALKTDLEDFSQLVQKADGERVGDYQEIILNVLRLVLDRNFQTRVDQIRHVQNIPPSWCTEKKFHQVFSNFCYHTFVHGKPETEKLDNTLNPFNKEKDVWARSNPNAITQPEHKTIASLAIEFSVHPERYGDFLLSYIYHGYMAPFVFKNIKFIPKGENRFNTRLILTPDKPDPLQMVGYIQFFRETTPSQICNFVESNKDLINALKKGLDEYPITQNSSSGTFKQSLVYFLDYCSRMERNYTGKLREQYYGGYGDVEPPNIRTMIHEFKQRIISSRDIVPED